MKVKPLQDRVLIKRVEEEAKTKGGIIIPDSAKEKPQEGLVVAVGPGKVTDNGTRVTPEVKAGDRILFGKYSGSEIKVDGVEHLILREDDILAVFSK
ncbi:MAG: co-chaperone GroES [Deltaproteobacteria bacterium]|nr:MAG: co-chaperone GroES [Deltaproteobacteria bacterium]